MRAGKLDRRITIRRALRLRNALGEDAIEWVDVATVWGQQRPVRGAERFQAQQVVGEQSLTFHIRYRPDLTSADRVVYDGREYNIVAVRELGRRTVTEFDATAHDL